MQIDIQTPTAIDVYNDGFAMMDWKPTKIMNPNKFGERKFKTV